MPYLSKLRQPDSARSRHSAEPVDVVSDREQYLRTRSRMNPTTGKVEAEEEALSADDKRYKKQLEVVEGYRPKTYTDTSELDTIGIGTNLDALDPKGKIPKDAPDREEQQKKRAKRLLDKLIPEKSRSGFTGDNLSREDARHIKSNQVAEAEKRAEKKFPEMMDDPEVRRVMVDQSYRGTSPLKMEHLRTAYKLGGKEELRQALLDLVESGEMARGNDKRTLRAVDTLSKKEE